MPAEAVRVFPDSNHPKFFRRPVTLYFFNRRYLFREGLEKKAETVYNKSCENHIIFKGDFFVIVEKIRLDFVGRSPDIFVCGLQRRTKRRQRLL